MTSVIFATVTRTVTLSPSGTFYGGQGSACFSEEKTTSGTITAALTLVILVVALVYCAGGFYLYRFTKRNPKAINEATGSNIQTYTPRMSNLAQDNQSTDLTFSMVVVYAFLILVNIIEVIKSHSSSC